MRTLNNRVILVISILISSFVLLLFIPAFDAAANPGATTPILSTENPYDADDPPYPQTASLSISTRNDTSLPLINMHTTSRELEGSWDSPTLALPKSDHEERDEGEMLETDPSIQGFYGISSMPTPTNSFEGISNRNGVLPPDTNGDIGPNHYVQWVNLSLAIWDRDGVLLYGPVNGNTLWNGFGGPCQTTNNGDPIVLYDHLADRWFLSQFALPAMPSGPFYQCIAVSTTGDPTGTWYRYEILASETKMNDYPHFGVWPDAYYMTANQFNENSLSWGGQGVWAFERSKMLQGLPAQVIYYDLHAVNSGYGGMLPTDLDGSPPPTGTPNYFVEMDDNAWGWASDRLSIWEFSVNWDNPASSTFGLSGLPNQVLNTAAFNTNMCNGNRDCIPQPDTTQGLDAISDRLLWRIQYRIFDNYATMVTNHTVDVGSDHAGIRWYELRDTGGGWSIFQQGTYAPDTDNRWMGSAAMDNIGNIAIGYSVSSGTTYPSIRYAGRLVNDPLGMLSQGETTLISGGGSQTSSHNRWGDYSSLSVDPVDECTFWYTQEYYQTTSSAGWQTRIGSFKFPNCTLNNGTLSGNVINSEILEPLPGSTILASSSPIQQFQTDTNEFGDYSLILSQGHYTVSATLHGYYSTTHNVDIFSNTISTLDFELTPIPTTTISGTISDSDSGWPLYGRIDVSTDDYQGRFFSEPTTGHYQIILLQGQNYEFSVSAESGGYLPASRNITTGSESQIEDFDLTADDILCTAPGYGLVESTCETIADGLVIGNAYDANTNGPFIGAIVSDTLGNSAITFTTPDDASLDDGFYILGTSMGGQNLTASFPNFGDVEIEVDVTAGSAIRQDFYLPSGKLNPIPSSLSTILSIGRSTTVTLVLSNTGDAYANFFLGEVNAVASSPTSGQFALPLRRVSPKHLTDLDASGVYLYTPPTTTLFPGGGVIQIWDSELSSSWGIGVDALGNTLWLGEISPTGVSTDYRFLYDGTNSGGSIDVSSKVAVFGGDMAYDPINNRLYQINVGGDGCIFSMEPNTLGVTSESICPDFGTSQRGLAFDLTSNTFYSGSWNDGIIHHFDMNGIILDSENTQLNISGLAFNPMTHHLFVLSNADIGFDVYVLDVNADYALLGGFDIPGMGNFEQAGLGIDCDGHLWGVNQSTSYVYEVSSGETGICGWTSISWLDAAPTSGQVPSRGTFPIVFNFDATDKSSGLYSAQVRIYNDTPYGSLIIPARMTVVQDPYDVELLPSADGKFGDPGTIVSYTLELINLGKNTDTFTIETSSQSWYATAPASVGPLTSGGKTELLVEVSVPEVGLFGEMDTTIITATSQGDNTKSATSELTTTANGIYGLSINPETASINADPGTFITYTFHITNHSNITDSFTLNITNTWKTEAPTAIGPLGVNETINFPVTVMIPGDAFSGGMDDGIILVASQNNPGITAYAFITTTANTIRNIGISPHSSELTGLPGQIVTHTLLVTNSGNITDTYSIETSSANWTTTTPPSIGPLPPHQTGLISVTVSIPWDSLSGFDDSLIVDLISHGDPSVYTFAAIFTLMENPFTDRTKIYLPLFILQE